MGFLERAIRRCVSDAVRKAVGNAVRQAVEPTVTDFANKTAQHFDNAAQNHTQQSLHPTSGLEGAFSNLERAAQSYATKMSENLKVCPNCNKATDAEKTYCPECGSKLPETTVAQSAVCPNCNKQNSIGTKFCEDCGTKLPAAIQQEEAAKANDDAVMLEWDEKIPQFPKWNCGGCNYGIECYEENYFSFSADFGGNDYAARQAVDSYRRFLVQNGFHQAGQYPNIAHLYKRIDGTVYHVDTEHCFEGDPDCPTIGFDTREPLGGYDYVKPEPKKQVGLKGLFGF